jgi:GT2 family glycosyltransferase
VAEKFPLDITAIVIAYKSEERIVESIESLEQALAHLEAEILIVDNASGDRTVELARATLRRGRVIANEENVGYGKAANQAISQARGRYCMILNDDARVTNHAVDEMLAVLDANDDVALVGPKIVDEVGNPMPSARSSFPGPGEELGRLVDLVAQRDTNSHYPTDAVAPIDVAWLVGACIVGKTQILLDTGGFNPAFFLYVEDIDLCRRMRELGYRVVTVPYAVCIHTGSVSTTAAFSDDARILRRADAREIFYRIWYPRPIRSLIHLRRAIGTGTQPWRLE